MKSIKAVLAASVMIFSLTANAVSMTDFQFADETEEQHFKSLIAEIRCLVCQNQSLADSDASLATDLRREIFELMKAGKSDQEIIEFLVARYGDFVLYKPPLKPETYPLWFGPFVLLLAAGAALIITLRRRSRSEVPELSDEQRKALDRILGKNSKGEGE